MLAECILNGREKEMFGFMCAVGFEFGSLMMAVYFDARAAMCLDALSNKISVVSMFLIFVRY